MGVSLLKLLDSPGIYGCSVLAGWQGIGNEVISLSVVEAPMAVDIIFPGDFVLSSGFFFKDNYEEFVLCVKAMADKGASGLGIPPNSYVKVIPSEVIEICNELRFPLISLPFNFRFSTAAFALFKTLESENKNESQDDLFSETLSLINDGLSLPSIINMLARKTDATVILQDEQKNIMFQAVNEKYSLTNIFPSKTNLPNNWTAHFALVCQEEQIGSLLFVGDAKNLDKYHEELKTISAVLATGFLQLSRTIETLQKKKRHTFLDILFKKDACTENDYIAIYRSFELRGRIIVIYLKDVDSHDILFRDLVNKIEVRCQSEDPYALVAVNEDFLIILFHNINSTLSEYKILLKDLLKIIRESFLDACCYLGGGDLATTISEYRKSYIQAKQTAEISFLSRKQNQFIEYRDLGLLKIVKDEKNTSTSILI
jgi:purine catabolism regulator